jgi:hypothetical protein
MQEVVRHSSLQVQPRCLLYEGTETKAHIVRRLMVVRYVGVFFLFFFFFFLFFSFFFSYVSCFLESLASHSSTHTTPLLETLALCIYLLFFFFSVAFRSFFFIFSAFCVAFDFVIGVYIEKRSS